MTCWEAFCSPLDVLWTAMLCLFLPVWFSQTCVHPSLGRQQLYFLFYEYWSKVVGVYGSHSSSAPLLSAPFSECCLNAVNAASLTFTLSIRMRNKHWDINKMAQSNQYEHGWCPWLCFIVVFAFFLFLSSISYLFLSFTKKRSAALLSFYSLWRYWQHSVSVRCVR